MYPFERFSERAKKVLTLAQEEAERSHRSYIGTEHLLLGLLREGDGLAHRVLATLGVEVANVREIVESVIGRDERIVLQQVIPTSRVKKVIELSFEEAQRMGHPYVGTEHLLLGLLLEGEGIAARVLNDLGVTLTKARAEIERQLISHETPESVGTPAKAPKQSADVSDALESNVAALVRVLRHPQIANLLRTKGLSDVEGLAAKLGEPPPVVANLRERLRNVRVAQASIQRQLDEAENDWLRTITSESG
jgi:ATP-dependent Clp protease ATP-binding subunit ClpA